MGRLAIAVVLVLMACKTDGPIMGPPTGATCPPNSTLTYENFGKPFMEHYCTQCHDQHLMGDDRMGAPDFHDFDTLFGIQGVADHIDRTTAAGPNVINRGMPEDDPKPTDAERYMLGEWLACGAPSETPQQ